MVDEVGSRVCSNFKLQLFTLELQQILSTYISRFIDEACYLLWNCQKSLSGEKFKSHKKI
jgi:hypothetical protein